MIDYNEERHCLLKLRWSEVALYKKGQSKAYKNLDAKRTNLGSASFFFISVAIIYTYFNLILTN